MTAAYLFNYYNVLFVSPTCKLYGVVENLLLYLLFAIKKDTFYWFDITIIFSVKASNISLRYIPTYLHLSKTFPQSWYNSNNCNPFKRYTTLIYFGKVITVFVAIIGIAAKCTMKVNKSNKTYMRVDTQRTLSY